MEHHRRGLRRLLHDDQLATAIERDFESAGLDARRLAMLRFAARLTREPGRMARRDIELLREQGLSDVDVLHLVEVVAYYAFANRIADGLGINIEP